ncbi:MAG: hypothetical protein PHV74_06220 [Dehalococcoidia bacterium]|nr:hypothetical protein [Dehalococcoidia bacterium]
MFRFMRRKRVIRGPKSRERGAILIVALIVLAVGSLVIPPTLAHIGTGTKTVNVHRDATARVYAADAGVEYALKYLASHDPQPTYYKTTTPTTLNDNTVTVEMWAQADGTFKIIAAAEDAEGRTTSTVAYADVVATTVDPLEYGVFALGNGNPGDDCNNADIYLQGDVGYESSVEDDAKPAKIYANGNICLGGSVLLKGSAYATDVDGIDALMCTDDPSGTCKKGITGTATEEYFELPEPDMGISTKVSDVNDKFDPGDSFITLPAGTKIDADTAVLFYDDPVKVSGSLTLSAKKGDFTVTFNGGLLIEGDLNIEDNGTIGLTIGADVYVTGGMTSGQQSQLKIEGAYALMIEGDVLLNGGAHINDPDDRPPAAQLPFIVSCNGNITLQGNSGVAAILYAANLDPDPNKPPKGTIDLGGGPDLYGIALADRVVSHGGNTIVYPTDAYGMDSFTSVDAGKTTIEYWKVN